MLSRAKRRFGNAAMEVIGDGYDNNVDTRVSQGLQNVGRPAYIVPKELERFGDPPLRLVDNPTNFDSREALGQLSERHPAIAETEDDALQRRQRDCVGSVIRIRITAI
jgi:hypothetical protein